MVDKITKFLKKYEEKLRRQVLELKKDILDKQFDGYDVKQFKGHKNFYRLRKGKIRIIFEMTKDDILIKKVSLRDDRTYSEY